MMFFGSMHPDWQILLPHCEPLLNKIELALENREFVPSKETVMRAFVRPPRDIKVAIFGQDPYPGHGDATGLAFSIPRLKKKIPASLRNIYTELHSDLDIPPASHGDLTAWVDQGVALVNRSLTFTQGFPSISLWEDFTNEVARVLGSSQIIGVFWGKDAQQLSHYFPKDQRIISAHPSPLSAYRGFFGSKPFSRINQLLEINGREIVDWRIT